MTYTKQQKSKARRLLWEAVRDGKLRRPDRCVRCRAKTKVQGHHADYGNPLKVEWLCVVCHMEVDAHKRNVRRPITDAVPAKQLHKRLLRLHALSSNTDALHIWFAAKAQVAPWTVTRWLTGRRQFRGTVLALLEAMEYNANIR